MGVVMGRGGEGEGNGGDGGDIPIEHSTMPQMASHVGSSGCPSASGFAALMATWATRRQAKRMQTKPLAKRSKMAIFLLRGIWRLQVSFIGSAITVQELVSTSSNMPKVCLLMRFVEVSTVKE
jgi:hypothetical protein